MVEGREARSTDAGREAERRETPVWVLDGDERITYVNETAGRLFESPPSKLEGTSFWSEVPASVEDRYREAFGQVFAEGEATEFELFCPRAEGWFRVQAYPLEDRVSVHAHEITEEVNRRQELELREQALRDAYELTADREAGPREKIEGLLSLIRTTLGTEIATLSRIDREAGTYGVLVADADEPDLVPDRTVPLEQMPTCAEVARTEQTLVLRDVEEQAPDLVDPTWGVQAYLGAPVWADEELFGTLSFSSRKPRSGGFDDWEETYVDLFSDWIGAELERRGGWPGEG